VKSMKRFFRDGSSSSRYKRRLTAKSIGATLHHRHIIEGWRRSHAVDCPVLRDVYSHKLCMSHYKQNTRTTLA
jgi:hypothetical protein